MCVCVCVCVGCVCVCVPGVSVAPPDDCVDAPWASETWLTLQFDSLESQHPMNDVRQSAPFSSTLRSQITSSRKHTSRRTSIYGGELMVTFYSQQKI